MPYDVTAECGNTTLIVRNVRTTNAEAAIDEVMERMARCKDVQHLTITATAFYVSKKKIASGKDLLNVPPAGALKLMKGRAR